MKYMAILKPSLILFANLKTTDYTHRQCSLSNMLYLVQHPLTHRLIVSSVKLKSLDPCVAELSFLCPDLSLYVLGCHIFLFKS